MHRVHSLTATPLLPRSSVCQCETGKCACAQGCAKDTTSAKKESCDCAGNVDKCKCQGGACVCASCPKSKKEEQVCGCGGNVDACTCKGGACSCSSCPKSKETAEKKSCCC